MEVAMVNEVEIPDPTKEQSGCIRAIGKESVHKICSGQVVLSLAVAVKELVENAIDAGATLVEVRLRDQGLDELEVCDNGCGVAETYLEGMTAKYYTSKIREFVDLQGVETFGFRGEALSSLCALSDMTIVTQHKDAAVGVKIVLDHEGMMKERTPCARSVGTTVTLTHLFDMLPVRKRDFARNIKKEFAKMCQMLQAYCLVAKGVRIICTNHTLKGGRTVVMQTHGAQDVSANISAVFGSRQLADVVCLKSPFGEGSRCTISTLLTDLRAAADDSMEITSEEVSNLNAHQFKLEGYVSNCSHGTGRSSKDRQYFYINHRPCDSKNISKVVNDVYHRYNAQQYPFVYLDVMTVRSDVDVNLAPDKRQLLIHNEKLLLLVIRKALLDTFGNIPATYTLHNASLINMLNVEGKSRRGVAMHSESVMPEQQKQEDDIVPLSSTQLFAAVLSQWKNTGDTSGPMPTVPVAGKRKCVNELEARTLKMKRIQEYLKSEKPVETLHNCLSEPESDEDKPRGGDGTGEAKSVHNKSMIDINDLKIQSAECDALIGSIESDESILIKEIDCKVVTTAPINPRLSFIQVKHENKHTEAIEENTGSEDEDNDTTFSSQVLSNPALELDDSTSESEATSGSQSCAKICTSMQDIANSLEAEEQYEREQRSRARLERLRFKSEISPNQNENAEAELQKEISKETFAHMEILGQFNLGFIIVKLETDLFIVDQHATDEKYNFEMLQRTTTLQNQPLAVPQTLEMTAVNEMVLLSHLEVFEKNGFRFEINDTAPPTQKVRLLGRPFSRNWEFGKEDIDELIFMLQDAPEGTICRPSRIRAMFASRACRKSVMIGKALHRATMKLLIKHMGEIEQPWNCPHGRPTMRHLINTDMLLDEDTA